MSKRKLMLEEERERVLEVRVLDVRERKSVKQRSFSVFVKTGAKDDEYPSCEEFTELLKNAVRKKRKVNLS